MLKVWLAAVIIGVVSFAMVSTGADAGAENETLIHSTDGTWTDMPGTTVVTSTGDKVEGSGSAYILVSSTFTTGLVAFDRLLGWDSAPPFDLTGITAVRLWVKYSATTAAGDWDLVFDNNEDCSSPLAHFDLPAGDADVWFETDLPVVDSGQLSAVVCVGLSARIDNGSQVIKLDHIRVVGGHPTPEQWGGRTSQDFSVFLFVDAGLSGLAEGGVIGVQVACPHISADKVPGLSILLPSIPVDEDGRFRWVDRGDDSLFWIAGRFASPGLVVGRAIMFKFMEDQDGNKGLCRSGVLRWFATGTSE